MVNTIEKNKYIIGISSIILGFFEHGGIQSHHKVNVNKFALVWLLISIQT